MTQFLMNEQPARSSRGPLYLLATALLVLAGGLFWAWKTQKPVETPAPAVAPAAETTAQTAAATTAAESQNPSRAPEPAAIPPASTTPQSAEAPTDDAARALLAEAQALAQDGKWQPAREKGLAAIESAKTDATRTAAEELVGKAGTELLFTPRPMPEKIDYTVQPGDSLAKIAQQYGTTVELIQKINNISGSVIRPNTRLRVFTGKWEIRVNKTRNDLLLLLDGHFFKRYRVGTGEYAKTPVGEFTIVDRIPQPTWWHPDGRTIPYGDPENLLGTHWLALNIKGYGIHGTWEPETIGKQASMGCVRLVNEDVTELFTIVTIGTPVIIEE